MTSRASPQAAALVKALRERVTIVLGEADLAAVLTEAICEEFWSFFKEMRVESIARSQDGTFRLEVCPLPKKPVAKVAA